MRREDFERRLLDFVNRALLESDPTLAVDAGTALFEERVLTSLRILDLIAFVENETGSTVPDEAVRLANFRSVRAIAAAFAQDGGSRTGGAVAATAGEGPTVIRVFGRRPGSRYARTPEELEACGEVALVPPGRAVFRRSLGALLDAFDVIALGWALDLGAEERFFPRRILPGVLARAGHAGPSARSAPSVPPAICYHAYPAAEGRDLGDRLVLLTARGPCFRPETGLELSALRLRHFTMREIVALGERGAVERFRQRLVDRVSELVTELDLVGRIETAQDPFFTRDPSALGPPALGGAAELRGRRLMQQVLPLKYELRLALDQGGRTCAAASFNHHLDFFGRRFGIRQASGEPAHSGCVAFGLERWGVAFLCRHGSDARAWPAAIRESRALRIEA